MMKSMKIWKPKGIKALRNNLGLSQAKMGELLGVSEDYVSMLERGIRNPGKSLCFLMDRIKAENVKNGPRMAPRRSKRGKKA
jgi:transcriptional regulator with XRE-family HTH domain